MYSKMLSLRFPKTVVNEPITVNLVKKFDLSFNPYGAGVERAPQELSERRSLPEKPRSQGGEHRAGYQTG